VLHERGMFKWNPFVVISWTKQSRPRQCSGTNSSPDKSSSVSASIGFLPQRSWVLFYRPATLLPELSPNEFHLNNPHMYFARNFQENVRIITKYLKFSVSLKFINCLWFLPVVLWRNINIWSLFCAITPITSFVTSSTASVPSPYTSISLTYALI
jgi:hypothetical protein